MSRLLIVLALVACTRTKEVQQQEQLAEQATASSTIDRHLDETVQRGAETITTTTEEFAYGDVPPGLTNRDRGSPDGGVDSHGRGTAHVAPEIIKRTVVIDQRGAVTDTKTAEAKGASAAALTATDDKKLKLETKTRAGPSPLLWLAIGAGLTIALGVCWKLGLLAKAWGSL